MTLTPARRRSWSTRRRRPLSRPEPGGTFTFTVVVTNTSPAESVTITSLTDDIYGNIATQGHAAPPPSARCWPRRAPTPAAFTGNFTGNAGASQTDIVTVLVTDDDGQTATDTDDATVTLTDVLPTITVDQDGQPPDPSRAGRHVHLHRGRHQHRPPSR